MQKTLPTQLLPSLSMPEQVQINDLPVDIIDKAEKERSNSKPSLYGSLEPPVNVACPLRYSVAQAGGVEWSLS